MRIADKVYVKVNADFDEQGDVVPKIIYLPTRNGYLEVLVEKPSKPEPRHAKKAGGHGYAIDFFYKGKQKQVFIEPQAGGGTFRWFVECNRKAEGV